MKLDRMRAVPLAVAGVLLLLAGVAAAADVPLVNWMAPPTWTPSSTAGGHMKFVDISGPVPFIPVTPCRVADTRPAFAAATHPPKLVASVSQNWQVTGLCGVPASAVAVSANFAVVSPSSGSFLKVYPPPGPAPSVSTLNFSVGQTVANAAIVPLGAGGQITVVANGATDLIMDVNGYYTNYPNLNEQLFVSGNFDGMAAIVGYNYSNANYSHGVGGWAGGTGFNHGVQGGVNAGAAANSSGVHGYNWPSSAAVTYGVFGENNSTTNGTAAVYGNSYGTAGQTYGVVGLAGGVSYAPNNSYMAGGRFAAAASSSYGALGEGQTGGLIGMHVDGTGVWTTYGIVGYSGTDGFYTPHHLTASGGKSFAEPLPTDPSRVIKYVCPEGPESGTYFRGRGRFVNRTAVIEVPEHFRIVTEEEGLTVQITPIGRAASVGVVQIGLNQIEVESTRDVEFSYLVQGIRKAYKDWQPVQNVTPTENLYFIPQSASHMLESFWPQEIRQRLISNGTYNADGTVNMSTAERMGWAQKWRDEEKARLEAAAKIVQAPRQGNGQNGQ